MGNQEHQVSENFPYKNYLKPGLSEEDIMQLKNYFD